MFTIFSTEKTMLKLNRNVTFSRPYSNKSYNKNLSACQSFFYQASSFYDAFCNPSCPSFVQQKLTSKTPTFVQLNKIMMRLFTYFSLSFLHQQKKT